MKNLVYTFNNMKTTRKILNSYRNKSFHIFFLNKIISFNYKPHQSITTLRFLRVFRDKTESFIEAHVGHKLD